MHIHRLLRTAGFPASFSYIGLAVFTGWSNGIRDSYVPPRLKSTLLFHSFASLCSFFLFSTIREKKNPYFSFYFIICIAKLISNASFNFDVIIFLTSRLFHTHVTVMPAFPQTPQAYHHTPDRNRIIKPNVFINQC